MRSYARTGPGDEPEHSHNCAYVVDIGMCLVELTLHNGREKLGHGKSLFVVTILYMSHFFSAWVSKCYTYQSSLLLP